MLAAYLALAVGYYVTIERDFMHSWQLQRAFWQQVAACCSDLQDGTVLIYELDPADEPTFIFTNSWSDPLVLDETFAFPSDWANPPRLFSLTEWQDRVEPEGDHLRWWVPGASWDEHWETFPQGNVILLRKGPDGSLQRVTGTGPCRRDRAAAEAACAGAAWPPAQLYAPLPTVTVDRGARHAQRGVLRQPRVRPRRDRGACARRSSQWRRPGWRCKPSPTSAACG